MEEKSSLVWIRLALKDEKDLFEYCPNVDGSIVGVSNTNYSNINISSKNYLH